MIRCIAYLISSTNESLTELLDSGEEIIGMLEIDTETNEMAFTVGNRIAFQFTDYMENQDKDEILLSDGNEYYIFSKECPERIV